MEIRYFQIIIPLLSVLFLTLQIKNLAKGKVSIHETIILGSFWIGVTLLALFPDFVSRLIASLFGIQSNINAVVFFTIGMLFYIQFKLYKITKKQDRLITELTRKIALDNID